MSVYNSATEFAQVIQITNCLLDALMKTAPAFSLRARYLESAKFLLVMAFGPDSLKDDKEDK